MGMSCLARRQGLGLDPIDQAKSYLAYEAYMVTLYLPRSKGKG